MTLARKLTWTRGFLVFRAAWLTTWAVAASCFVIGSVFHVYGQDRVDRELIANENRITKLEAGVDRLASEFKDLKTLMYWALFGTAGLGMEAGIRVVSGAKGRAKS